MSNITDEQRQQLGHIVDAAKRNALALFEVVDTEGKPAVLLVAIEEEEEEGRMYPLARVDVAFNTDFEPPDGMEVVDPVEDEGLDNAGQGC